MKVRGLNDATRLTTNVLYRAPILITVVPTRGRLFGRQFSRRVTSTLAIGYLFVRAAKSSACASAIARLLDFGDVHINASPEISVTQRTSGR